MERRLNCLICDLSPISRTDVDGLCVSCRAAVAFGLYRVHWSFNNAGEYRRLVEFVAATEDPLGAEYPNIPDPIEYRPEDLPRLWSRLDRAEVEVAQAETILTQLTQFGGV